MAHLIDRRTTLYIITSSSNFRQQFLPHISSKGVSKSLISSKPDTSKMSSASKSAQPKKSRTSHQEPSDDSNSAEDVEPQGEEDFFSRLPDELILKILSHLRQSDLATMSSLDNQRLHDLSKDPFLWTAISLPLVFNDELCEQMKKVLPRCKKLEELHLCEHVIYNDVAISALEHCPKLHTLQLRYLSPGVQEAIAAHGQNLRNLDCQTVGANALALHPESLTRITTLTMDSPQMQQPIFYNEDLNAISVLCPNLEGFAFIGRHVTSRPAMTNFFEATKNSLKRFRVTLPPKGSLQMINRCQLLEKLDVTLSQLSLAEIMSISSLSKLTSLRIGACNCELNSDVFVYLFGEMKLANLEDLELVGINSVVDDRVLETISRNCPRLARLSLSKVRDKVIKHILERCRLRRLELERLG